jgi:hypothetical protein
MGFEKVVPDQPKDRRRVRGMTASALRTFFLSDGHVTKLFELGIEGRLGDAGLRRAWRVWGSGTWTQGGKIRDGMQSVSDGGLPHSDFSSLPDRFGGGWDDIASKRERGIIRRWDIHTAHTA